MKIEIGLPSYPSTGYQWEPDREPSEESYFDPYPQDEDTPDDELRFGGEIIERFVFEDVPHGTDLTFKYRRHFEPLSIEPIRTVTVHIEER